MLGKISALACSDAHVYAGLFDGSIYRWPLQHIADKIATPVSEQNPEESDDPMSDKNSGQDADSDLVERVPQVSNSERLQVRFDTAVNQLESYN
jgi:hypothetical protein